MGWLPAALAERGQSQAALARHLGIDKTAVTRIIQGKRAVKVEELQAIRLFLGVDSGAEDPAVAIKSINIDDIARQISDEPSQIRDSNRSSLHSALASRNDREIFLSGIGEVGDSLLEYVFECIPNKDINALTSMLLGHRKRLNLDFLAGLSVSLGRMPQQLIHVLGNLQATYDWALGNDDLSQQRCIEEYNDFSRFLGLGPAAAIEEARALFVVAIGAFLSVVSTRFDPLEIEKAVLSKDALR